MTSPGRAGTPRVAIPAEGRPATVMFCGFAPWVWDGVDLFEAASSRSTARSMSCGHVRGSRRAATVTNARTVLIMAATRT